MGQRGLEMVDPVSGPCERISGEDVKTALASSNPGKAAGPSEVVEMLRASGEAGLQWVTDICNEVVRKGKYRMIGERVGLLVFTKERVMLLCGSYRGIKLLDQVMKVFERVIEKKVRDRVKRTDMQFGFRAGRGTTDATFVVRQVQERYWRKTRICGWHLLIWKRRLIEFPAKCSGGL